MIAIRNLTYHYPNSAQPALHKLSLQVAAGEFVLLAGPSGAGKSTLLRCLNGLVPHFSGGLIAGSVQVAGLDALRAGPRALSRAVGFVFQDPLAQTVVDRVEAEIAFALENTGMPAPEMRVRVEEMLDLLDLAPLRERPITTLSGGERQRVAIAAALALHPPILALDEPTSQLDPRAADELLQVLARLNDELGLTIMLAEHRLERVLRSADRLIYLPAGQQPPLDGPPRTILPAIPLRPPLADLALAFGWQPLPLTVKEGLALSRTAPPVPPSPAVQARGTGAEGRPPAAAPAVEAAQEQGRAWDPEGRVPALDIRNLHFWRGQQAVLRDISLSVRPGEALALMGRNGSGKTTLLRCVVGLLRPQQGSITLAGRPTAGRDVADICRELAYLPQDPDDLLFAESVEDELLQTLRNHGIAADPAALLERLGLSKVARAYPRDLSVGQRQRVALGAVTITAPPLLLLDEPTRGLDYQAKQALVALWRGWLAEGAALLLVTHDVELAALIADRVAIISQGELIAEGPARQVMAASPLFAPQIARLFPGSGWLTLQQALSGLGLQSPSSPTSS
jgi:energy-coupling factor transport system ATP-binding protein